MISPYPVTFLTPNLYITDNEIHILDCLIDYKALPPKFDISQVIGFYAEEDYHLVIFLAKEEGHEFQMYVIKDFSRNVNDLGMIRDMFARMTQEPGSSELFKKAHFKLDSLFHMAKTMRATIHKDVADFEED